MATKKTDTTSHPLYRFAGSTDHDQVAPGSLIFVKSPVSPRTFILPPDDLLIGPPPLLSLFSPQDLTSLKFLPALLRKWCTLPILNNNNNGSPPLVVCGNLHTSSTQQGQSRRLTIMMIVSVRKATNNIWIRIEPCYVVSIKNKVEWPIDESVIESLHVNRKKEAGGWFGQRCQEGFCVSGRHCCALLSGDCDSFIPSCITKRNKRAPWNNGIVSVTVKCSNEHVKSC